MNPRLLPEEDALDDPDEDGEADPTLPGDLWFRHRCSTATNYYVGEKEVERVVYSRSFAPS